jgi:hypothetical protein
MTADRKKKIGWRSYARRQLFRNVTRDQKLRKKKGKRITIKRSKWAEEENGLDMALYR